MKFPVCFLANVHKYTKEAKNYMVIIHRMVYNETANNCASFLVPQNQELTNRIYSERGVKRIYGHFKRCSRKSGASTSQSSTQV